MTLFFKISKKKINFLKKKSLFFIFDLFFTQKMGFFTQKMTSKNEVFLLKNLKFLTLFLYKNKEKFFIF